MAKQIDGTEFACLTINADLEAENEKLKKEFILTRKAFKLACREIQNPCEYCRYATMPECCIETNCAEEMMKHFKQQAEQEVEDGKS